MQDQLFNMLHDNINDLNTLDRYPISQDDILNLKIELGLCQDVNQFMSYQYLCFHCYNKKTDPYGLCTKCHQFPIDTHLKIINLSKELDKLQSQKNNGRGISCVRTIISFLCYGDTDLAKNVYEVDGDKICGVYPDIDKLICQSLNIKPRYTNCGWY